jgi:hypothetical protein
MAEISAFARVFASHGPSVLAHTELGYGGNGSLDATGTRTKTKHRYEPELAVANGF